MAERALDRKRGAIPFPEAGEGVWLRLLSKDRMDIEAEIGKDWAITAEQDLINKMEEGRLVYFLKKALKGPDLKSSVEIDIDEIDLPRMEIGIRILDVICLGNFRRTYEEQINYTNEQLLKLAQEGVDPPLVGPETSSTPSGGQDTGPDSDLPRSMN